MKIKLTINGKTKSVQALPTSRLIDVLREDLHLTGTKEGCGEGECGACSIILNGKVVNSCIILFGQMQDEDEILTIESLEKNGKLHKLQQSFLDHGAVHCGMCIPGIIMSAYALLSEKPKPTEREIREGLAGNLCRCTGYGKIIDAVKACRRT